MYWNTSMKKHFWITLLSFETMLCVSPVATATETSAPLSISQASGAQAKSASVLKELNSLVLEFYPRAKATLKDNTLRFELKMRPYVNPYTHRQENMPADGGISGDVELKKSDKQVSEMLPKVNNFYLYNELLISPYSKTDGGQWKSRLLYPPDTSVEFLERYKKLVAELQDVDASVVTASATSAPSNPVQPAVQAAAPTTTTAPAVTTAVRTEKKLTGPITGRMFLWKAVKGKETVYLLGTIHCAYADFYPLPAEMDRAFEESKNLIVEIAIDRREVERNDMRQWLKDTAFYKPPDCLSKHMSPETKRLFTQYLNWAGETVAMYEEYKPWYVREIVQEALPAKRESIAARYSMGVDLYYLGRAKELKKQVSEFETLEMQFKLDSKLTQEAQDKLLQVSLVNAMYQPSSLAKLFEIWRSGDPDRLERFVTYRTSEYPELASYDKLLLDDRNIGMANKLDQLMKEKPGPHFVAVGAAHMVGPTGLVEQLKRRGFIVEQLSAAGNAAPNAVDSALKKQEFPNERFSIWLPGTPKRSVSTVREGLVTFEFVEVPDGCYEMSVTTLSADKTKWSTPGPLIVDRVLSSVVNRMNGKETERKTITVNGIPVRQIAFEVGAAAKAAPAAKTGAAKPAPAAQPNPNEFARANACLVDNRIYVMFAVGKKGWLDSDNVHKFLSSLEVKQ